MPLGLGIHHSFCLKCQFPLLCLVSHCSSRLLSWRSLPRLSEVTLPFPTAPGLPLVIAHTYPSPLCVAFVHFSFQPCDVCERVPSESVQQISCRLCTPKPGGFCTPTPAEFCTPLYLGTSAHLHLGDSKPLHLGTFAPLHLQGSAHPYTWRVLHPYTWRVLHPCTWRVLHPCTWRVLHPYTCRVLHPYTWMVLHTPVPCLLQRPGCAFPPPQLIPQGFDD